MNNIQVECFLSTAILESYTKAAEYMHLSQPTVSRYIASLEEELQCTLLKRTTKKVEMTEAGKRYYRLFSHWKSEAASTMEEVSALNGVTSHKLKIGYLEGWPMQPDILRTARAFEKVYPHIQVEFVALGASEIMNALLNETLDLAIMLENLQMDMENYGKKKICDIKKAILYSVNHPLAEKKNLEIDDFLDEDFLVLSEDLDYVLKRNQELYEQFHYGMGIKTIENMQTLLMRIAEGRGVSIQDEWGPACVNPVYKQFLLDETIQIFMVWKRLHSQEEIDIFEKYFAENFEIQ